MAERATVIHAYIHERVYAALWMRRGTVQGDSYCMECNLIITICYSRLPANVVLYFLLTDTNIAETPELHDREKVERLPLTHHQPVTHSPLARMRFLHLTEPRILAWQPQRAYNFSLCFPAS
jgi:hypothetical protein